MREIKFRGKIKRTQATLDAAEYIPNNKGWVTGNLIVSGEVAVIAGGIAEMADEYIAHEWWAKVEPETVGQFTGLLDKNGREIYEGDVLHCFGSFETKHKYEVKFGKYEQDGSGGEYGPSDCLGFYAEYLEKGKRNEYGSLVIYEEDHTKSLLEFVEYEVIGNIYENPELLNS